MPRPSTWWSGDQLLRYKPYLRDGSVAGRTRGIFSSSDQPRAEISDDQLGVKLDHHIASYRGHNMRPERGKQLRVEMIETGIPKMLNRGLMLGDETLIDLTTSNEWVGDPIV
jgi:hypothetical protein